MTLAGLDPLIHAPVRLQICAILSATDEAEFALVREETGVSESVLSKQVKLLEEASYVRVRKATLASRQRTWLALTAAGRKAFAAHMRALTCLAAAAANGVAA
jgi:DNA-binding MarR family transcriptional regulator